MDKRICVEGNRAAALSAYKMSEVIFLFPITPASAMGEHSDAWAVEKHKNFLGNVPVVTQLQSEAAAIASIHGASLTGALATTYSASQGLILMVPNMLKIAGELLPVVIHVAARSVSTSGLTIYADHSDVMTCRTTGFAFLASNRVQEANDFAAIAHLSAIKGRVPFLHFFDGFRTSHEMNGISEVTVDILNQLVDREALDKHRQRALSPLHPVCQSTIQGNDIVFQAMERINEFYEKLPDIVEEIMNKFGELTGRKYGVFEYIGHPEATTAIALMGSGAATVEETVLKMAKKGHKVGLVKVRLFRPFSLKHLEKVLPKTLQKIAVLDRTKESGSIGEPLYLDFATALSSKPALKKIDVYGGRFGVGGKEFNPMCVLAVFNNLNQSEPKNHFTVGIDDDITHHSIPVPTLKATDDVLGEPSEEDKVYAALLWGFGSDGTVGACHEIMKIINDEIKQYCQAYFYYDAHKAGGVTMSHLRYGKKDILSEYTIVNADYIACHHPSYVFKYPLVANLKDKGLFVLNGHWDTVEEMEKAFPPSLLLDIASKKAEFYVINATKLAEDVGLGRRINTIMEVVLFKLLNIIPFDKVIELLETSVKKTYASKGTEVIEMNCKAIRGAAERLKKIDYSGRGWDKLKAETPKGCDENQFINDLVLPSSRFKGDALPVSAFSVGGDIPGGLSIYEKRGVSSYVSHWNLDKCVECNMCSVMCPHACIRPFLATEEEMKKAPKSFETKPSNFKEAKEMRYRIQISVDDCTGCGVCINACNVNALDMQPYQDQEVQKDNWKFAMELSDKSQLFPRNQVRALQFYQPLLEFSGACEGCGETPHMKMLTQLMGERMVVSNASGCSSVWGGTWGTSSYTKNQEGRGPSWGTSLFEDNAEYSFGKMIAYRKRRENLMEKVQQMISEGKGQQKLRDILKKWIEKVNDSINCEECLKEIKEELKNEKGNDEYVEYVRKNIDLIPKVSYWASGGDGWAYDIGFGGLDHVIAQGLDVNMIVYDTEVYSNTGGQKSKATPTAAMAKFAAGGNENPKKDLGMVLMQYGNVYVASVAVQANPAHAVKAFQEADSFPGPSIVLCYAPCREHGFPLSNVIEESKVAVKNGYWPLYRYDPRLKADGKNPFQYESNGVNVNVAEFTKRENRFEALKRKDPESSQKQQDKLQQFFAERHQKYLELAKKV